MVHRNDRCWCQWVVVLFSCLCRSPWQSQLRRYINIFDKMYVRNIYGKTHVKKRINGYALGYPLPIALMSYWLDWCWCWLDSSDTTNNNKHKKNNMQWSWLTLDGSLKTLCNIMEILGKMECVRKLDMVSVTTSTYVSDLQLYIYI